MADSRKRQVLCWFCLSMCVFSSRLSATETDQYLTWRHPLRDSTGVANRHVNDGIARVLAEVNASPDLQRLSCNEVAARVMWEFSWTAMQWIELWADYDPRIDAWPPVVKDFQTYRQRNERFPEEEMLHRARTPFDWLTPISEVIRLDDVYVGTDKLSHFMKQGWQYHETYRAHFPQAYRAALADGKPRPEAALIADRAGALAAINRGIKQERGGLGAATTGVFSYGDMEANYQGMRFFNGLCEGPTAMFRRTARGWVQTRPFDWSVYVSPLWDESYNVSAYTPRRWALTLPIVRQYCEMLETPPVQALRRSYAEQMRTVSSLSQTILIRKIRQGEAPDPAPFALERVCRRQLEPTS